jgi:MFS family permease
MSLLMTSIKNNKTIVAAGWFFCSLFFFYAFILRVSPAVMVEDLMREFSVGAAILGNLSAVYLYAYAGLQIPVGICIDRFGLRGLVAGACALCGVGCIIFSTAESISLAYVGRFFIGAGAAFSFVGALNMAARWFPAKFAVLGGWAQMMGSAGGFMGQAPLGIAVAVFGWRSSNVILGVAGLCLAALLVFTVRDPIGSKTENRTPIWNSLKTVASNKQTWLASISAGGLTGTLLAFGGLWGVPYLMVARNIVKEEAAAFISVAFIGWAIGAPLLGWLSDRLGRRRVIVIIGTTCAALSTTALLIWPNMPGILLVITLAIQGAFSSSMIVCFALTRENNPAELSGAALGLINTFAVGTGAVLQPLTGLILDLQWDGLVIDGLRVYDLNDYQIALSILPAACVFSLIAAMYLKEK